MYGFALVGRGFGPLVITVILVIIIGFNICRSRWWGIGLGGLDWWKYSRDGCGGWPIFCLQRWAWLWMAAGFIPRLSPLLWDRETVSVCCSWLDPHHGGVIDCWRIRLITCVIGFFQNILQIVNGLLLCVCLWWISGIRWVGYSVSGAALLLVIACSTLVSHATATLGSRVIMICDCSTLVAGGMATLGSGKLAPSDLMYRDANGGREYL